MQHVAGRVLDRNRGGPRRGIDLHDAVRIRIEVSAPGPENGVYRLLSSHAARTRGREKEVLPRDRCDRACHHLIGNRRRIRELIDEDVVHHVLMTVGCQEQ